MSVHYKFKSALEYDTVTFDGLHISVKDLKNAIIQQKRIGRSTDFDLQVTNAQTKEVYEDEDTLIPKNTSLLIARIPLAAQTKSKTWEGYGGDSTPPTRIDEGPIAKAVDLANLDASEDDKIRAMISQSTQDYDPSNYVKIRGANQMGAVPPNYRCYKCHQSGHWIKDCPLSQGPEPMEIKKSTGIPRSFMVPVDSPQVPGAMMTPNGQYAVPVLDHLAYTQKQQPAPPVQEPKPEIPEDLLCSICSDLLTDAVMIPCCGNSFCDECIRSCLLESEEHECPDCHEKDISPGTLIPNRYLRNSVLNFKNNTGYTKRQAQKPPATSQPATSTTQSQKQPEEKRPTTPTSPKAIKPDSPKEVCKPDSGEKTVISEADSTEPPKKGTGVDFSEDIDINEETKVKGKESPTVAEGPPGVSPRESPKPQPITSNLPVRQQTVVAGRHGHRRSHDRSPRRPHHRSARSPQYHEPSSRHEDRAGTPTVDEPGMGVNVVAPNNVYIGPTPNYTAAPPTGSIPPIMGLPQPPVLQGAPPVSGPYTGQPPPGVFPPTQGPPPNFRLPPPNQYNMPVGPYNVPPRPVFDPSRPPVGGPVPPYSSGYSGHRSSRNRDYSNSGRGMRGRTPPGIIDDPLEAFNRMLREKDERERRAKQRKGRSYSRSSSRSFSRSPVRRMRSRSPRRRNSRSRSRSFSMSRSRSRSFSPGGKGSPPYRDRDFSPRGSPRRRAPSRYRSPVRSPPRYRYKEGHNERGRDYERDRDFHRDNRAFSREREYRDRERDGNTDYHYYGNDGYNKQENRGRTKASHWGQGAMHREGYYPPPQDMQVPPPYRFPPRDGYNVPPPYIAKNEMPPMHRRYEDVAPPGTEQPPVPGMEPSPQPEEKYQYSSPSREFREKEVSSRHEKDDRKDRHHRYSRSPPAEKVAPSTRKSRDREKTKDRHESPDKHKRKRREDEESDKEKHKKDSDEDKLKKLKDKKKKKEKKEADKKKRKEKKEKREKKEEKEKKVKEEVKKVKTNVEEPPKEDDRIENIEKVKPQPEEDIRSPEKQAEETKPDLYGDILTDGIDTKVVESYGKIEDTDEPKSPLPEESGPYKEEADTPKEYDDSEKDILELHTNEADLKSDLDKSEVLAPVPEKSKWEMDEDAPKSPKTPDSSKQDYKSDKSGKVTNEVLKRAENAIFAKAINAIRPIEIKKISTDRAKLYSGDRERKNSEEFSGHNIQVTIASKCENTPRQAGVEPAKCVDVPAEKPRLSVKERLGVKVEDLDRIVKVDRTYDRNRSCSLSPLSKRASELGGVYPMMERRVEVEERRRYDDRGRSNRDGRYNRNFRSNDRSDPRRDHRDSRRDRDRDMRRRDDEPVRRDDHRERRNKSPSRLKTGDSDIKKEKRKRSLSRSESADRKDRKKKKDKKQKRERGKRHHKKEDDEKKDASSKTEKEEETKPKPATDRRKPTLDEASFEPDYDLETESEKEEEKVKEVAKRSSSSGSESDKKETKKKDSSSSDSSDSSSEEDRKKKKHKKHKKKRSRKDSSSSSSDSESESSEDEKERKKKRHKKKQKKRKKSKHK